VALLNLRPKGRDLLCKLGEVTVPTLVGLWGVRELMNVQLLEQHLYAVSMMW